LNTTEFSKIGPYLINCFLTQSPAIASRTASSANARATVVKSVVDTIKHSTGHIPVMVSTTDFTTVVLALADDAVKNATAGDFVYI
jgi:hypothetical protein